MPLFNAEKYIREAAGSILSQDFTDFEFIVVNDGSTDRSEELVREFRDPRIRIIRQENLGIGSALQRGCAEAAGRYIARMDADDISLSGRLSRQFRYMEEHPGTVLLSGSVWYIDETGRRTGRSFPYLSDSAIRRKLPIFNPICHPGVMMRRDAYRKTPGYSDLQPFEDHLLWISMAKHGKFANLPETILEYRILENSLSRALSARQEKKLFGMLKKMTEQELHSPEGTAGFRNAFLEARTQSARAESPGIPGRGLQWQVYSLLNSMGFPDEGAAGLICRLKGLLA